MDELTKKYYQNRAGQLAGMYTTVEKGISNMAAEFFGEAIPGELYLDVGSGTGRDLNWLLSQGYDAMGIEPVAEMREVAIGNNIQLKERLCDDSLPGLTFMRRLFPGKISGIMMVAVIQHISRDTIDEAFSNLSSLLEKNGKLLISMPGRRPGIDSNHRDETGRLFVLYSPEEIDEKLMRLGFQRKLSRESQDALGRSDVSWVNMGFVLKDRP